MPMPLPIPHPFIPRFKSQTQLYLSNELLLCACSKGPRPQKQCRAQIASAKSAVAAQQHPSFWSRCSGLLQLLKPQLQLCAPTPYPTRSSYIQCERAHLCPSTCPALGSALLRAQEVKDAYPCPNPPLQCTVALLKQVRRVWATSVLKGCLTARVSLPLRLEQRIRWAPSRPRYQGVRVSTGPGRMERHSTVPVRGTKVLYTCLCVRIRW